MKRHMLTAHHKKNGIVKHFLNFILDLTIMRMINVQTKCKIMIKFRMQKTVMNNVSQLQK